jgi:hypothetical protein
MCGNIPYKPTIVVSIRPIKIQGIPDLENDLFLNQTDRMKCFISIISSSFTMLIKCPPFSAHVCSASSHVMLALSPTK